MFRPNVKLVLEPGAGARIVDEVHQRTLTLTPTEGRILALIGPGTTTDSLAAAAKGAGIDVEAAQVEALLSRLRANELIDFTPSPGKLGPVALLPDDVVPAFRSDLHVAAAPKPGLMLVTDKKRDRSFTLYDFEVHIARLLDGRHRVTQVIELAGRIGIPITPESLGKFISQMKAYGFIAESAPVAPPAEDPTWPSRSEWSSEIRELYQSALRQFRLGRPGHAIEYLDALVEIRPDTPEAIELKKRVEASLDSGPVMEVSFEDLHGVEEPMPELTAAADVLTGGGPQLTMPAAALGEKPLSPSGTASALKPPPAPEGPRLATIALPPPAASAPSPAPSAPVALGDMLPTPSGKSRALGERFTKPFTLGEASFAKPAEGGAAKPGESAADLAPKPSAPRLTDEIAPLALPVAPKPSAPIYGKPIFGRPLEKPAEPKPSPIFSKPAEPEAAPKPPAPLFSKPAEPEAAPKPPAPLFSKPAEPEAAPKPPAPLFSKPAEPEAAPRPPAPLFSKPAEPEPAPRPSAPLKPAEVPPAPKPEPLFARPTAPDPAPVPSKPAEETPLDPDPSPPAKTVVSLPPEGDPTPPQAFVPVRETAPAPEPSPAPRARPSRPVPPRPSPPRLTASPPEEPAREEKTVVGPRPVSPTELELPAVEPEAHPPRASAPTLAEPSADAPPPPRASRPLATTLDPDGPPVLRPSAPPADRPRAVTLDVPVAKDADPDTSGVESPLESEATELIPAAPPRSSPARVRRSMPPNDEAPPRPSSLVDRVGADATAPSPAPRRSAPRPAPVATAARPTASRAPLIIGGALLLVTVAVLFPIPSTQRLDVELVPTRKAEPKTPAGVFGTLKVPSGTRVDQGAVIATLDVSKLKADRDELKATVARLESAAAKTSSKTNPAVLKKARLAVAKANQELAKAKAVAAKRRDDSKAQQDVAKKEAALEQAQRVAESADGNQKAKAMRAEAAQVKQRAAALDKQLERANIVAPATGVFELEAVPPAGAQFDDGTPFGRILDSTLLVKGAPADAVDPVLITPDRRIPLFAVDRKPEGLTVPFEGNVKPGPAKLEIPKGYRPWPMVLLAR